MTEATLTDLIAAADAGDHRAAAALEAMLVAELEAIAEPLRG